MNSDIFKSCPTCSENWATRDEMVADPQVSFAGYQAFVRDGVLGLFLFNHLSCGTTMALSAKQFEDLKKTGIYQQSAGHEKKAVSHCLTSQSDEPCPKQCECAFVQEVIDTIS
jgi:hypothetical protein